MKTGVISTFCLILLLCFILCRFEIFLIPPIINIFQQSKAKPATHPPPPPCHRYTVIVASITPQARASLAERFGLSPMETHARLVTFLRGEGVQHLFDSSLSADFSLLEAGEEFIQRYHASATVKSEEGVVERSPPPWAAPSPTVALSSTRRFNVEMGREEEVSNYRVAAVLGNGVARQGWADGQSGHSSTLEGSRAGFAFGDSVDTAAGGGVGAAAAVAGGKGAKGPGELLVLTSACPGWVCYAEKTAPEALSCMSTVKSPQQVLVYQVRLERRGGGGILYGIFVYSSGVAVYKHGGIVAASVDWSIRERKGYCMDEAFLSGVSL